MQGELQLEDLLRLRNELLKQNEDLKLEVNKMRQVVDQRGSLFSADDEFLSRIEAKI